MNINKLIEGQREFEKRLFGAFAVLIMFWLLLLVGVIFYTDYLNRVADPIGYERERQIEHARNMNAINSSPSYGFCDMWMVDVMPQFISPHGCN